MLKIYKYKLSPMPLRVEHEGDDSGMRAEVEMPAGATILAIHNQGIDICLWAVVATGATMKKYKFAIYGTGWELPSDYIKWTYVGTAHVPNWMGVQPGMDSPATFVWHIFDVTGCE